MTRSAISTLPGRSPYGERGLKCDDELLLAEFGGSLSLRRAWIEMLIWRIDNVMRKSRSPYGERGLKFLESDAFAHDLLSLAVRRAGVGISASELTAATFGSLSLRRAWIEMLGWSRR